MTLDLFAPPEPTCRIVHVYVFGARVFAFDAHNRLMPEHCGSGALFLAELRRILPAAATVHE